MTKSRQSCRRPLSRAWEPDCSWIRKNSAREWKSLTVREIHLNSCESSYHCVAEPRLEVNFAISRRRGRQYNCRPNVIPGGTT